MSASSPTTDPMTPTRLVHVTLAIAAMAAALSPAPLAAADPPASARPWLDIKLPPPPAAGAPTAKATFALTERKPVGLEYAGVRLSVGGAAPTLVPAGQRAELVVAASASEPLRLEIGGARVLAHVRPGDTLAVHEGHDGGWVAVIGNRMKENAPRQITRCGAKAEDCPVGYAWALVHPGDPVCPVRTGDDHPHKCVKATVVRARGPLTGRAEVSNASASGRFDDLDTVSLAPRPLSANAFGAWIAVEVGSESMPWIRLGDAQALLVIGPGESYQVWLDDRGRVDSAQVAPK